MDDILIKKWLNLFINFIIFIKFLFLINVAIYLFIKYFTKSHHYEAISMYIIKRIRFLFTICLAILLIFIFSPRNNHTVYITPNMTFLFYAVGFLLITTANWSLFLQQPVWLKDVSMLAQ
jgi:hypothetical protein